MVATTTQGLILFAHGARDARWAAPFEAVAQRVRSARPGVLVRLAYLELMQPTLAQAGAELVAAGCAGLHVLPMFLGAGGHVRQDLPRLVAELQRDHPEAQVTLHPPVGELGPVADAMAAVAVATLEAP